MRVVVPAFAKINVTLRVLGARPDGYHGIRTVFQSLALRDTIAVEPVRGPVQIVCSDPGCPVDETNLAWRAADGLWRRSGRRGPPRDIRIRITKRIPMQAGLGGGSSDAAATLVALDRLWRLNAGPTKRRDIARSLGADVPYFLEGGTALGLDRGDLLFPLADLPSMWVVLVIPDFGVSTKDAYGWWDERCGLNRGPERPSPHLGAGPSPRRRSGPARRRRPRRAPDRPALEMIPAEELRNDLEAPVAAHHPELGRIVSTLGRAGADYAAMSGSGSAVFGLFGSRRAAAGAAERCGARTRRVILTRTLGRTEYALRSNSRQDWNLRPERPIR